MVSCDLNGSLFHSTGVTVANHVPVAFVRQTEETDDLFPQVKLLDLIRDDKYGAYDRILALKIRRLYLNRMRYGKLVEFF